MQIISLSNHIIRKALQLSLVEMAVLCDIKQMSQSERYGYWCVKSKEKMADWLDLSRSTIFNAINALELKGYIERSQIGIRPSQFIIDLDCAQDEIGIYIKTNDIEMVSAKIREALDSPSKNYTVSKEIGRETVQKLDGGQSKNYTQDSNREKKKRNNNNLSENFETDVPSFVKADRQKAREAAKPLPTIPELKEDLLNDKTACEILCMQNKVSIKQLQEALEMFSQKLIVSGEEQTKTKFRSYFGNWLPKNIDKLKPKPTQSRMVY